MLLCVILGHFMYRTTKRLRLLWSNRRILKHSFGTCICFLKTTAFYSGYKLLQLLLRYIDVSTFLLIFCFIKSAIRLLCLFTAISNFDLTSCVLFLLNSCFKDCNVYYSIKDCNVSRDFTVQ